MDKYLVYSGRVFASNEVEVRGERERERER